MGATALITGPDGLTQAVPWNGDKLLAQLAKNQQPRIMVSGLFSLLAFICELFALLAPWYSYGGVTYSLVKVTGCPPNAVEGAGCV